MITFSETEAQLDLSQIEKIEKKIGLIFPLEYKKHLLKYNGGKCSPNIFEFIENGKTTNSYIDCFLAIYDGEYDNLDNYIEVYKIKEKKLPSRLLPIAHDSGGNLICISCEAGDNGYIYFWDHEKELSANNDSNIYLVAKSFTNFINGLQKDL